MAATFPTLRKHNLCVQPALAVAKNSFTKDTKDDLFNGDIDWVYAEELAVRSNYFWSPDSKQIVFLQHGRNPRCQPIPSQLESDAPPVDNEKISQGRDPTLSEAWRGRSRRRKACGWISLTKDAEAYIPRSAGSAMGVIWAEVLNREQDKMDLYFVDAKSGKSRIVLTENHSRRFGWTFDHVEVRLAELQQRVRMAELARWQHASLLLHFRTSKNPMAAARKLERQLNPRRLCGDGIEGVDEAAGTVFFRPIRATRGKHHIFSVSSMEPDHSSLRR